MNRIVEISIVDKEPLNILLNCDGPCPKKFSYTRETNFIAEIQEEINLSNLNFEWIITPVLDNYSYRNQLKIYRQEVFTQAYSTFQIELKVYNQTHLGSGVLVMPFNYPPRNGTLIISPKKGLSLETKFYISCSSWMDEDLPLSYQFSKLNADQTIPVQISTVQEDPFIYTYLTAEKPYSEIWILVDIFDKFGATATSNLSLIVSSASINLTQTIAKVSKLLDEIIGSDSPTEKLNGISLLAEELSYFENIGYNKSINPCPDCEQHGQCDSREICVCQSEWTLPDCSYSVKDFENLINIKYILLQAMLEAYSDLANTNNTEIVLNNLDSLSNPYYNNITTISLIQHFLDDILRLDENQTILNQYEAIYSANILSNLIEYASTFDCDSQTKFTTDLSEKTPEYLDTIGRNSLSHKLTNQEPTILKTDIFDILTYRGTSCALQENSLKIDEGSPNITLIFKPGDSEECKETFDIMYFAFQANLFNCSITPRQLDNSRTSVSISIVDSKTGKDVSHDFIMEMTMPAGHDCPSGCVSSNNKCICENLSLFNPKQQLASILKNSNLKLITRVDSLLGWKFYTSFAFWAVCWMTGLYLYSLKKLKNAKGWSCVVKELQRKPNKTTLEKIKAAFLVTIISSYFYHFLGLKQTNEYYLLLRSQHFKGQEINSLLYQSTGHASFFLHI